MEKEQNTVAQTPAADKMDEINRLLNEVYVSMTERGYDPITQFVAYILSDDPANITSHNDARSKIRSYDRDELLRAFVEKYFADKK